MEAAALGSLRLSGCGSMDTVQQIQSLFAEEMAVLFGILAVGAVLGKISFRGVSFGAAGVLFAALIFGHFGLKVPKDVMDLGLVLFVYAVGLQAGPSFFRTFKAHAMQFVIIGTIAVTAGALLTVGLTRYLNLPFDLAAGLYTGALTCTPALAGAIDAIERLSEAGGTSAAASVGYGIAYPFSMLGVVLLVHFLPRLFRRDLKAEETRWLAEQEAETPRLLEKRFIISNPNCFGVRMDELVAHRVGNVTICRVRRGDHVMAAAPDVILREGDIVQVVGLKDELEKMRLVLGEETETPVEATQKVISREVDVTEHSLAGRKIGDLHAWTKYGVVITRLRRNSVEITPRGRIALMLGDTLRMVGDRDGVNQFASLLDTKHHKVEETNMVPFLVGLILGVSIGSIPVELPNGMTIKLGVAGGAFVVSLLVGHFGRIGPWRIHVPAAAKNLSRELGLMLFLAGAGTRAGSRFMEVVSQHGWSLFFAGAAITVITVTVGVSVMHFAYRMPVLSMMGALSATMTNPPGLGAANSRTDTDLPTLSYASVYPVALIFKILLAQVLVEVLRGLS